MRLQRFFGSGLAGNIGGYGLVSLSQMLVQLLAVPVFSLAWGLEDYGIWLLLWTLPSYLAVGDFGFLVAAGNRTITALAQGRDRDGWADFQVARLIVAGVSCCILILGTAIIFYIPDAWLQPIQQAADGHARLALILLTGYGICSIFNLLFSEALRATGHLAAALRLNSAVFVIEAAAALSAALAGGGFAEVAAVYLVIRLGGTVIMGWKAQVMARKLRGWDLKAGAGRLRSLARPALAAFVLPLADVASLQGVVVALGAAAGPAAIPAFAAARIASRLAFRLVGIINGASLPEYTAAVARGDKQREQELVSLSLAANFAIVAPLAILLLTAGGSIIHVWSGGVITAGPMLILAMVLAMVFHTLWRSLSGFLFALNLHDQYAPHFLGLSLLSLPLAYALAGMWGAAGAAVAMAIAEGAMLIIVPLKASQLGLLAPGFLRRMPKDISRLARRFIAP